jgi:pyridoxine 5-phosphate synthase
MMATLGVNIDHIATLRQARRTSYPDPVTAALIVEKAGADQITVHLREDRRHIQDQDLANLRRVVTKPLNLELAATDEIVGVALKVKPNVCTFVPEKREELTTEGGLNVAGDFNRLRAYTHNLRDAGVVVSMFIDPDMQQIEASREMGADSIELHTGKYCELHGTDRASELERLKKCAAHAMKAGLRVAAGHGLNYDNTADVVHAIPEILEYNIGHAIVARAIFVGLDEAVRQMKKILGGQL